MHPGAQVVTEPLANQMTRAHKRRPRDDERAQTRPARQHCVPRRVVHHRAVQVVRVVFDEAIGVLRVRERGVRRERALLVVDLVRRVHDVAAAETDGDVGADRRVGVVAEDGRVVVGRGGGAVGRQVLVLLLLPDAGVEGQVEELKRRSETKARGS